MSIRIESYAPEHVPAVRSFNDRLQRTASMFRLAEEPPQNPREEYLALDGDDVCGSFSLKRQQLSVNGATVAAANCQLPISAGTFEARYASLGMVLLRHALSLEKKLFCLGMGSRENRLPRMLAAMGWRLIDVPFLFRVQRPARFLRNAAPLRTTSLRRLLMDAVAASGAGWLGIKAMQARKPMTSDAEGAVVSEFGEWAGELWDRCRLEISLAAVRTARELNALYAEPRFIRLKVTRGGTVIGWAVLLDTKMDGHRYFGNLRVGTIVDAMALPDAIADVALLASRTLAQRGVDLIVTNQAQASWVGALRRAGFLETRTNYILALSPALAALNADPSRMHVTRGDGDGPIGL